MNKNTKVFLDIIIGNKAAGRLTIELFEDITPFTSENFRGLCSGDYGKSPSNQDLFYQDSLFFKLVPGKYVAGGDIVSNTGKSGESIYGKHFIDENFTRRHSGPGLLSTYNKGPNTNSSTFLITLGECPELDDKNIVFGQVVEGLSVLKTIEKTQTDEFQKPKFPIRIFNCGQLEDGREHIKFEEFRDQIKIYRAFEERKAQRKEEHLQQYYELLKNSNEPLNPAKSPSGSSSSQSSDNETPDLALTPSSSLSSRIQKLKSELKKAKKQNESALIQDQEHQTDPSFDKKLRKKDWLTKEQTKSEQLECLGISEDKHYLLDNIAHVGNVEKKKRKRNKRAAFGWDVFNTDSLMKAYKKRLVKIEPDKDLIKLQNEDKNLVLLNPPQEKIEKMASELEAEAEKRNKFSRRRPFYEDLDVNYINERNRVYNAKLARTYKDYAAEIKRNLERGTST